MSNQDEAPPPYIQHQNAVDRMTPAERLRSLEEFAEQQKYVKPGDGGTLTARGSGIRALVSGGSLPQGQYTGSLPPPEYPADREESSSKRKQSLWKRLTGRTADQPAK